MNPTITDVFCDWLTFTSESPKMNRWMSHFMRDDTRTGIHRAYHKQVGYEFYPSGMREYRDLTSHDNLNVYVMSGEALANIRREHDPLFAAKVVRLLCRQAYRVTRIDLTCDILDKGDFAHEFADIIGLGMIDLKRRKATITKGVGANAGVTTYIGARSSPLFLRVYDKHEESEGKVPSTRIEFECKQWRAWNISNAIAASFDLSTARRFFIGMLRDVLQDFDHKLLNHFWYEDIEFARPVARERMQDTKEWLSHQIMPTFWKAWDKGGSDLFIWFTEELLKQVNERSE